MRHLALLVVVAMVACKSDKPPAPTPTPTEIGSGSGSSVVAAGSGSDACVIKVTLTQTNIAWDGGGLKGQNDFKPGEPPHLDALRGLTKCSAWIIADDKVRYQDVVAVMDSLIQLGIADVALGNPKKPSTGSGSGSGSAASPLISGSDAIKDAPILLISRTEVRFHDKLIGTPDDDDIATKLAAVLPKDPKDPTLIIRADKDISAKTINRVITGAGNQGYDHVLFAVQNK